MIKQWIRTDFAAKNHSKYTHYDFKVCETCHIMTEVRIIENIQGRNKIFRCMICNTVFSEPGD